MVVAAEEVVTVVVQGSTSTVSAHKIKHWAKLAARLEAEAEAQTEKEESQVEKENVVSIEDSPGLLYNCVI